MDEARRHFGSDQLDEVSIGVAPPLPYSRQEIDEDDIEAVVECLRDDFLTTGPRVESFEDALCATTGADHAVVCSSGTAALHLASLALGLRPGDQVIVPSMTFVATAAAPRLVGADLVFADVDPESGLLTRATLADALARAPRAKAVFPVHLNGSWVEMPEVRALADDRHLAIVEDACHALGTAYWADGRQGHVGDGRYAAMTCFSFHAVKAIAMGEGGAITTNDAELAARLRHLRNHGITREPGEFEYRDAAVDGDGRPNLWYYEVQGLGLNYRASDVLCALGESQLKKLARFVARRRQLASLYDGALESLMPLVRPVGQTAAAASAFHLYAVLIDFDAAGRTRAEVMQRLREEGFGSQVQYVPVHHHPAYRPAHPDLSLPGADAYYRRVLSLPLFPALRDKHVVRVVKWLARALGRPVVRAQIPQTQPAGDAPSRGEGALERLVGVRPRILVFLPNTNELQRFVLGGAFEDLATDHELHYVLPSADAAKMRAAAPESLTSSNTSELDVAPDRFAQWSRLFQAACFRYANRSPSFAIRANLALRPGSARLLRLLPTFAWQATRHTAKTLLNRRWLPAAVRGRVKMAHAVLQEAEARPELFANVHGDQYEALVSRTLGGLEPLPAITKIFDEVNPLYAIIPTSLLDVFCNEVLWSCQAEDVACLLLQSGWDNMSSKGVIHHQPTFAGCWGEQSVGHAKTVQGISRSRTRALGAPHYEFLKPAPAEARAQFRAQLGVGDAERLVLFGGAFRQFDETGTLQRLDAAIEAGRLGSMTILYRPHPWRAQRKHEDDFFQCTWKHVVFDPVMKERYTRVRKDPAYLKRAVPMYDMAYLALVLSASDAVISPMSTLLVEALLMQRPTMAIAFGDGKHNHDPSVTAQMMHFAEAKDSGALIWCNDSARLEADCLALLEPRAGHTQPAARRRLLDQVVVTRPGTYAQRLAHFCRKTVEREARKLRGQRAGRMRGKITHAYGANRIACDYCDMEPAGLEIPGYWMHGWIPAYHNVDPAFIALHKKDGQHAGYDYDAQIRDEKERTPQWVSRADQADFLGVHGHRQVKAIGLPITYLPDVNVRRVPGSLLVMPPHSHKIHGSEDPLAELYASAIADLRSDFEHIWVCLNEDDLAKRQWVESFRRRGIGVFPSVDQSDPHTLLRLKEMLSTFECVTTNGYGSHIAYAAYWGARISVFGPFADFPIDRMARTHAVKMFPRLLDTAYGLCTEAALRKHYPFLFVDPAKATRNQEWGAAEVGHGHRLPPDGLATLFGWTTVRPSEVPHSAAAP